MSSLTGWFIAGLVLVALLSMYAPRIAGILVILIVVFIGVELANKRIL